MTTFEEDKKALLDQLHSGAFFEQAKAGATIDPTGEKTAEAFDATYTEADDIAPAWVHESIIEQISKRDPDVGPGMPATWYDDLD